MIKQIKNLTKTKAVNICIFSASVFFYFLLYRLNFYFLNFNLTDIECTALYSIIYVFCFYFLKKIFVKILNSKNK